MVGLFRQHLRRARGQLHGHMAVPALYFATPYVPGETPVRQITVRVHDHFGLLGDLKGTNFNYAEIEDNSPRIVFLRSEVEPVRNMVVSVEPGVAYRLQVVRPPNDITVTVRAQRLTGADLDGLPVPGDLIPVNARVAAVLPAFTAAGAVDVQLGAIGEFELPTMTVQGELA